MLRVDLAGASPGMKLAMAIHNPRRPGSVLLRAGYELDRPSIDKLRELGVHEAWIHCPGLEFMAEFVSPAVHSACHELAHMISGAIVPSGSGTDPLMEFRSYKRGIVSLLERLAENRSAAIFLGEIGRSGSPSLRHACNVCLVSVLTGLKLDFYLMRERAKLGPAEARDVTNLGIGALLHDVGMLRLDEPTLGRWASVGDESDGAFQGHVSMGYRMVHESVDPSAAAVVLQHHQRFDGTGFPRAGAVDPSGCAHTTRTPRGSEIHVFARIAAAADLLDRLRHRLEFGAGADERPMRPMVRALRMLMEPPYNSWVDPIVLRAILCVVPPYAPGTRVILNDGSDMVVVGWNPADPCRPTVAELVSPRRSAGEVPRATSVHIDLSRNVDLRIARAEGQDVSGDNFDLPGAERMDLARIARAAM